MQVLWRIYCCAGPLSLHRSALSRAYTPLCTFMAGMASAQVLMRVCCRACSFVASSCSISRDSCSMAHCLMGPLTAQTLRRTHAMLGPCLHRSATSCPHAAQSLIIPALFYRAPHAGEMWRTETDHATARDPPLLAAMAASLARNRQRSVFVVAIHERWSRSLRLSQVRRKPRFPRERMKSSRNKVLVPREQMMRSHN